MQVFGYLDTYLAAMKPGFDVKAIDLLNKNSQPD